MKKPEMIHPHRHLRNTLGPADVDIWPVVISDALDEEVVCFCLWIHLDLLMEL